MSQTAVIPFYPFGVFFSDNVIILLKAGDKTIPFIRIENITANIHRFQFIAQFFCRLTITLASDISNWCQFTFHAVKIVFFRYRILPCHQLRLDIATVFSLKTYKRNALKKAYNVTPACVPKVSSVKKEQKMRMKKVM